MHTNNPLLITFYQRTRLILKLSLNRKNNNYYPFPPTQDLLHVMLFCEMIKPTHTLKESNLYFQTATTIRFLHILSFYHLISSIANKKSRHIFMNIVTNKSKITRYNQTDN